MNNINDTIYPKDDDEVGSSIPNRRNYESAKEYIKEHDGNSHPMLGTAMTMIRDYESFQSNEEELF